MQDKSVRCDGCGAEAWVSVARVDTGQLDFCLHHYNEHSTVLHAQGYTITNDERYLINEKPSISVNTV